MKLAGPLILASSSPRRRELLSRAGIEVDICPPDIDDGRLRSQQKRAVGWATALAYLKARRVAELLDKAAASDKETIVLAADTVCDLDGDVIGQPRDAENARQMLVAMRNKTHRTISGVCLLHPYSGQRLLQSDSAEVELGDLSDAMIEAYLATGDWRGKAGGYNLSERIDADWPIRCVGDPATVMGLPMQRLPGWLDTFRAVVAGD